ncbi:hypothetical protein R1sor_026497 [Riccia sorocarpa]|uniref:Ubiquitin-like protease family profile domain-containing protein n=1 Tax=Riccia sorocarpa TaxID=122646 RepID=A0ABD3GH80_9MARC
MRAANPSWNGKHTQVQKCFVFFTGLELHGIKIDWSTVNASKAINRYSMAEKEKARKELWRMQVKFDGELCEAVDPDSKKRRRTPSKPTPNKHPRETSGNTELTVGAEDEPTNLSSGEAPSNQQPTLDKGKAVVEDEPTRLDPNLAAKMEKARVKEATRRSLEEDLLTVPRFVVNDPGESSGQRSKGNLDSSCPPRPTTEVEKTAEGVHGWIDEMIRNVMIANQERDQIQSRLKEAEEKLLEVEAVRSANNGSDRIQERLKDVEEKIKALEEEKKEMSERALLMERSDLYELLESKLTRYQICGHPYGIASFPDVNLTITKKWTTFPKDIGAFEGNMDALSELKHALDKNSGMTIYKTDCSVCGSKVINRDTGLQDVENTNPHPDELHAGIGGLVAVNEVDAAARNEDKIHLMTESDVQPLIAGLDRPELDADEFLQQVQHANSDYEVTPSRQTHTDYLEEIGDRTQARLRRETSIRGNGPTTRAQSRRLFVQAEEPADPQPQEPQPVETPTEEAVEEIQTPSTEPTAHEEVASIEPIMDVGPIPAEVASAAEESTESQPEEPAPVQLLVEEAVEDIQTASTEPAPVQLPVEEAVEDIQTPSTEPTGHDIRPIYTVEDPDVKDIGGPSSPGLHMQVYAPNVLQQPSGVVEIGDSPDSAKGTRDPLDEWKSYEQLTKKDLESTNPKRFIRGDVINMYIKEKFLVQPRSELEGKFFVNTFWFAKLNALNEQVLSGNLAGSVEKILRLRKGITPRVDDVQDIRSIFVPIHFGKGDFHWSLAVVHFGTSRCTIYHLDNALGTHNTTDFLSEVAKVKGDLGPYFDDESACRFTNVGDVDSFQLIFGMYMDPKSWTAKNMKRRVLS